MHRRFTVIISAMLLTVAGCSTDSSQSDAPANPSTTNPAPSGEQEQPAQDVAENAAGKMLAVPVTDWASAQKAVDAGVRHLFFGTGSDFSILNGQGNPERSIEALNQRAGEPLTVSVDEEGGLVQRLSGLIGELPSAKEMAETKTPDEVRDMMRVHGEKIRGLGITMDFAPVVDLAGGAEISDNAIGSRSFSEDPQVVVDYARAYSEGLQQAGVTPVLKHFPGHGHATGDSHKGSVSSPPLEELEGLDMVPFAQLASIPGIAVMVGHMQVPDLGTEEEQQLPASINPAVYKMLRQGGYSANAGTPAPPFEGMVYTDDLSGMAAVADRYTPEESAVAALAAGADNALVAAGTVDVESVVAAVKAAIVEGKITPEHARAAVEKTQKLT